MEQNNQFTLGEAEYRFAQIVWENSPINSGELVLLCEERLGWKKSTTYTVLKKLIDKQLFKNEKAIVTALVGQHKVQKTMSEQLVNGKFGGSLPQFIASFMGDKKISSAEAEHLKSLIDSYREG